MPRSKMIYMTVVYIWMKYYYNYNNFILKFDLQVPYNNNIIFTQNVLFFSGNVIFDEFYISYSY